MVKKVIIPRVTMTMIDAVIVDWYKKEGDHVVEGEPLLDIETDKTVTTMNSPYSGILTKIIAEKGSLIPIEGDIALISDTEEANQKESHKDTIEIEKPSTDYANKNPSKQDNDKKSVRATPLAKKTAEEKGADLQNIEGSGPRGMIIKKDVLANKESSEIAPASSSVEYLEEDISIPLEGFRARIAKKMSESRRTVADVSTFTEVCMDSIIKIHESVPISYTAFAIRAAALALREYPEINSLFKDDSIIQKKHININVAVATEKGVLTPVISNADSKNLITLAECLKDLSSRGRDGLLRIDDIEGGTFTVTNSGIFGSLFYTPIINIPQCAILGMGKIITIAVFNEKNEIIPKSIMILCLSYDHRIVDGESAVKFLQRIKLFLEEPRTLF